MKKIIDQRKFQAAYENETKSVESMHDMTMNKYWICLSYTLI